MSRLIGKIKYQYHDLVLNARLFRWMGVFRYYYYSYVLRKEFATIKLKAKEFEQVQIKIRCRNGVDRKVLEYVFNQKYHTTNEVFSNKLNPVILDLGSNIGCTILDFKLRYPGSIVYGYEMDIDNYKLAENNTRNLTGVYLFNKAVWLKKGRINYSKNNTTDAYSIVDSLVNSKINVDCLSMSDILKDNDIQQVDFLKMDIEGAEVPILNDIELLWLNKILAFNIEFHHISEDDLNGFIDLLTHKGFKVNKSLKHWSAIEGVRTVYQ